MIKGPHIGEEKERSKLPIVGRRKSDTPYGIYKFPIGSWFICECRRQRDIGDYRFICLMLFMLGLMASLQMKLQTPEYHYKISIGDRWKTTCQSNLGQVFEERTLTEARNFSSRDLKFPEELLGERGQQAEPSSAGNIFEKNLRG